MAPVLDRGVEVGVLTFVRVEDVAPDDLERLLAYGVLLDVEATDDPARWHAEDLLVAQVRDDQDKLRALVYFDNPRDGLRPTIARLTDLEQAIRPGLHAILVQIEREEFAQRIRLASATRAVIRSASPQSTSASCSRSSARSVASRSARRACGSTPSTRSTATSCAGPGPRAVRTSVPGCEWP